MCDHTEVDKGADPVKKKHKHQPSNMYFPCCVSCVAAAEAQCRNEGQRTSYTGVAARFIFMWKHSLSYSFGLNLALGFDVL